MQRSRILASWTSVWVIPRTRVRPGEAHGYTLLLFIDTVTPRGHFWWYFRPNDLHEDGDQSESKRTCWFLSKARSPSPLKQASVCFRFQSGLVCLHCPFVFLVWTRHRVSRPFVVLKKKKKNQLIIPFETYQCVYVLRRCRILGWLVWAIIITEP